MGSSLKHDHKSPHLSHARCEMKSFGWKCQVNNVSEEYKKRSEEGTSRRNGRKLSSDLMDQQLLGGGGVGGGWGAGKGGNVTVPEVGADVLPGNPGSYHSAGAKDWGHSLHCPPRKLLPRPCRLSSRDLPLWIWKLACMFPPLLAKHGYFPGAKGRQEVPCFLPPELVPVSVREHILGIPAFCGLY